MDELLNKINWLIRVGPTLFLWSLGNKMSQKPGVTAKMLASPSILKEHGTFLSVGKRERRNQQPFISLHSGRFPEVKFCSNLPKAIQGSLVFQGFYTFS